MIQPPCYDKVNKRDCELRSADCHLKCPRWAEYVKERDVDYKERSYRSGFTTEGKIRTMKAILLKTNSRKRHSLYKERWE